MERSGVTRPPAIIIGFELNGLGVARSLARAGIDAIALSSPNWNPAFSTNAAKVIRLGEWSENGLLEGLRKLSTELTSRSPIMITKDEAVLWVSNNREELEQHYLISLPKRDVVEKLMSKELFSKLALEEGWPTPRTWSVSHHQAVLSAAKEIRYPAIVKPRLKNSQFRNSGSQKAYRVDGTPELLNVYSNISRFEREVIIQEWVGGEDRQVAFCLGYWNKDSKPLALFPGRKLRQFPVECGNTALCEPAPDEWEPKLIELTDSIFRQVGCVGLASMEFKIHPSTDAPYIMEPTIGRTNYQSEIAVINGINLPAIAYYDTVNESVPSILSKRALRPVKLVDQSAELSSALWYSTHGRLSLRQWLSDRGGSTSFMLWRLNDPAPAASFLLNFFRRGFRKGPRFIANRAGKIWAGLRGYESVNRY
jgi:D-aspartate ligase